MIGVCKSVEDVTRITTKNSREVSKRNIQLMDMSGKIIQVTMWGNEVSRVHPGKVGNEKAGNKMSLDVYMKMYRKNFALLFAFPSNFCSNLETRC